MTTKSQRAAQRRRQGECEVHYRAVKTVLVRWQDSQGDDSHTAAALGLHNGAFQ